MSREFKFRAWHYGGGDPRVKPFMAFSEPFRVLFWERVEQEALAVEVMQYTGLEDKNGVEIYEGDIDKDHLIVTYVGDLEGSLGMACGWYLQSGDFDRFTELLCETGLEVIGNIYENPELLEVENE